MNENRGLWRGKRLDNGEWVEGYYVCLTDGNDKEHRIYTGYAETDCGDYYPDFYKIDPKTLGECTSLIDKKGVKIFEGNIVTINGGRPLVIKLRNFEWVATREGRELYLHRLETGVSYEVIGNVYDNPELLQGGETNE